MTLAAALEAERLVLDGGLSTELERRGYDVSGRLWSAALLREDPQAILEAHLAFLRSGAQVITTASYQATLEGFAAAGIGEAEGRALWRRSVELAREAIRGVVGEGDAASVWVAGSVGPYGAFLADGSEYTGAYAAALDVDALVRFHRPRMEALAQAGVDVLACETLPAHVEAQAIIEVVRSLDVPSWLSLTTVTGPDGVVRTRLGEDAAATFALARDVDAVIAVGVNCTEPAGVGQAVRVAAAASGKPVVVYPNSGESWDAARRAWYGQAGFAEPDVAGWMRAGARLIGGCCRVQPEQISVIRAAVSSEICSAG